MCLTTPSRLPGCALSIPVLRRKHTRLVSVRNLAVDRHEVPRPDAEQLGCDDDQVGGGAGIHLRYSWDDFVVVKPWPSLPGLMAKKDY